MPLSIRNRIHTMYVTCSIRSCLNRPTNMALLHIVSVSQDSSIWPPPLHPPLQCLRGSVLNGSVGPSNLLTQQAPVLPTPQAVLAATLAIRRWRCRQIQPSQKAISRTTVSKDKDA